MSKYSKLKSNYIKRSLHKRLDGGTSIFERDWYTIGSRTNFGPGKQVMYSNGHFVFTGNNVASYPKKTRLATDIEHLTYGDVEDKQSNSNEVKQQRKSCDIRDFAYYGSASELVRVSIENIIRWFPSRITSTNQRIELGNFDGTTFLNGSDVYYGDTGWHEDGISGNTPLYVLNNSFNIDLINDDIPLDKIENIKRYFLLSWNYYTIKHDGSEYEITDCNIAISPEGDCLVDWQWDNRPDDGESDKRRRVTLQIQTEGGDFYIYGFMIEEQMWFFSTHLSNFEIKPSTGERENFFNSLDGFEAQLMNRMSNPLYSNEFLTPRPSNLQYYYVKNKYTWPSDDDGYILIDTSEYVSFVNDLYTMAQRMDELWCDNLWRNMTHEAIKNFDWTYTREYNDADAENNIEGGEHMKKILHVMAKTFDDAKLSIDGLKCVNNSTYNRLNNIPEALLTDKLEMSGWDVKSTMLNDDGIGCYNCDTLKWYKNISEDTLTPLSVDIEVMNRLLLSSKRILSTKGTVEAIDMVMGLFGFGDNDYEITEEYYTAALKLAENNNIRWDEIAQEINNTRAFIQTYDGNDPYFGIPLKRIKIGDGFYLIPYYSQDKEYEGNLYYQSRGGWGKYVPKNTTEEKYSYSETVNYLRMVEKFSDLLELSEFDVQPGVVYYVSDLSSLLNYSEYTPIEMGLMTHYFVLKNSSPNNVESWYHIKRQVFNIGGVNYFIQHIIESNTPTSQIVSVDGTKYHISDSSTFNIGNVVYSITANQVTRIINYTINNNEVTIDEVIYTIDTENKKVLRGSEIISPISDSSTFNIGNVVYSITANQVTRIINYTIGDDGFVTIDGVTYFTDYVDITACNTEVDISNDNIFELSPKRYKIDGFNIKEGNNGTSQKIITTIGVSTTTVVPIYNDNMQLLSCAAIYDFFEKLTTNTHGNNPHIGYGNYDDGNNFFEYIKQPFKFAYDNGRIDESMTEKEEFFVFSSIPQLCSSDNMVQCASAVVSPITDEMTFGIDGVRYIVDNDNNKVTRVIDYEIGVDGVVSIDGNEYTINVESKEVLNGEVIPSKVITITNKLTDNSGRFNKYFNNVILHYLMQVIPSTSILILNGYE